MRRLLSLRLLPFFLILGAVAFAPTGAASKDDTPAKVLFSEPLVPSPGAPEPIGSYSKGCMPGAEALPIDGPHWQVMRLSRNRNWGQPELVQYIEKLADAVVGDGWNGLLVGDMAQPR